MGTPHSEGIGLEARVLPCPGVWVLEWKPTLDLPDGKLSGGASCREASGLGLRPSSLHLGQQTLPANEAVSGPPPPLLLAPRSGKIPFPGAEGASP